MKFQSIENLKSFLDSGNNPDMTDEKTGDTVLQDLLYDIDEDNASTINPMIELLLEKGASPNLCSDLYFHPVFIALRANIKDTMYILLEAGADLDFQDNEGLSPLRYTVEESMEDMVKVILNFADPSLIDKPGGFSGATPLGIAFERGHDSLMEFLLNKGADPEAIDNDGKETFYRYPVARIKEIGKTNYSGGFLLRSSAKKGCINCIKYLVNHGADIEVQNGSGATPLFFAVLSGKTELVEYLINKGADLLHETDNFETLLHWAAEAGTLNLVKLFTDLGFEIDNRNRERRTPYLLAARKGHREIVSWLAENGADINATDSVWKRNAIHEAAIGGHDHLIKYLVDKGMHPNLKDGDGNTPVYLAAKTDHLRVVSYLHSIGVNINKKCENNNTSLMEAVYWGSKDIVSFLIEKGAEVCAVNDEGDCALSLITHRLKDFKDESCEENEFKRNLISIKDMIEDNITGVCSDCRVTEVEEEKEVSAEKYTIEKIVEEVFTTENPNTGHKANPNLAWVVFENGTIVLTGENDELKKTATVDELKDYAVKELKSAGQPVAGTPSADFSVHRLSWFPEDYIYMVSYDHPNVINIIVMDGDGADIAVGMQARSIRGEDCEDLKVRSVRTFDRELVEF